MDIYSFIQGIMDRQYTSMNDLFRNILHHAIRLGVVNTFYYGNIQILTSKHIH